MAEPTDPLMVLTDAIVADLATAFPTLYVGNSLLTVTTRWGFDPVAELESDGLASPAIVVIDAGEDLTAEFGGNQVEILVVNVAVQMLLPADDAAARLTCRALSGLLSQIGRRLRPRDTTFMLPIGDEDVGCVQAKRADARQMGDLRNSTLFMAELATKWKRY